MSPKKRRRKKRMSQKLRIPRRNSRRVSAYFISWASGGGRGQDPSNEERDADE
jgi:hypothetical protein